ncbi:DedA family protein [Campylobacter sp. US33a]|uniref:DedA family protein n=1 Tax=Campylobacter sp. CCS1377 TaxID=3158229 RepID=A0AAU7E568_9BACT|nr:DedA family protein [Campylobacter sp. US33a]MCW1360656.1 DedA family protein [Campylobacter jejuni]TEY03434.1 DedA family protein [Campylobacter sp. US33a]
MQEMLDTLLKYGYIALFFYSLGGGMVGILTAGVLSAQGHLNLSLCIALAFIANIIGSTLLFIMGKYYKKDLLPYFKNHRRKIALAMIKIRQYGNMLIVIQKFIYGLKTFIPMAAGIAKFSFLRFFIINALASAIWAVGFGYLGFAFGHIVEKIFGRLSNYPYLAPIFLILLILIFWFYLTKFSKRV